MKRNKPLFIVLLSLFFIFLITPKAFSSSKAKCVYFYSNTCSSCMAIERELQLSKNYSEQDIIRLDVSEKGNLKLMFEFCDKYGVGERDRSVPIMFLGKNVYTDEDDIIECIKSNGISSNRDELLVDINSTNTYEPKIDNVTIPYLLFAGLLDGFNPCAMAMIMLLISLLGFMKEKKTIIRVSCCFILGIFITYYLIGTRLYSAISNVNFINLSIILNYFILALCLILFALNLYDGIKAKRGSYRKVILQLPKGIKKLNKTLMERAIKISNKKLIYLISFVLGIAISVTEFMCTGQIYLPVILLMSQAKNLSSAQVSLNFLIYNIAFILPLVVISIFAIQKEKIISVSSTFTEKMHIIKFANAAFYLALGILVLLTLIF